MGGAGSAVLETLQSLGLTVPVLCLGVPDVFTAHGDPKVLLQQLGLDAKGIQSRIEARFAASTGHAKTEASVLKRVV